MASRYFSSISLTEHCWVPDSAKPLKCGPRIAPRHRPHGQGHVDMRAEGQHSAQGGRSAEVGAGLSSVSTSVCGPGSPAGQEQAESQAHALSPSGRTPPGRTPACPARPSLPTALGCWWWPSGCWCSTSCRPHPGNARKWGSQPKDRCGWGRAGLEKGHWGRCGPYQED